MANPTRATAVRISAELYTTSSSTTNRRWIITARPRFTCRHPCLRFADTRFWAAPSGADLFCSHNRMGGFYGRIDDEEVVGCSRRPESHYAFAGGRASACRSRANWHEVSCSPWPGFHRFYIYTGYLSTTVALLQLVLI